MAFGANQFPLVVPVSAVDKFTAPLGRIGGALEGFGKKAERIGRKLSIGLSLPLAAFGTLSVRTGLEYQRALNRVQVVTGATGAEVAALQEKIEGALGEKGIQTTARESAAAMLELAHSGETLAEVETTLPGVIALATSASTDQAVAARVTTNVLDAYHLTAADAAATTDLLALAAARGQQELEPLGDGLVTAARAAKAFDQDLPTTAATLDLLADLGAEGSAGAAIFGQSLAALRRPSAAALKTLDRLGIKASELSTRAADGSVRLRPFDEILQQLGAHGATSSDALALFGKKAGASAFGLIQGAGRVRRFADELRGAGGAADTLAKVQLSGGVGTLEEFNRKWERLLVTVARSGLIEGLGAIASKAGDLFTWISHLDPALLKWTIRLGTVAAVAGPALIFVGQMSTALGGLASAAKLIGAAGLGPKLAGILGAAAPWAVLAVSIGSIVSDVLNLLDAIHGVGSEPAGGAKIDRPAMDALAFPAGPAASVDRARALGRGAARGGAASRADVSGRVQVEFTNTPPGTRIRARQTGDVPLDVDAGYVLAAGLSG